MDLFSALRVAARPHGAAFFSLGEYRGMAGGDDFSAARVKNKIVGRDV